LLKQQITLFLSGRRKSQVVTVLRPWHYRKPWPGDDSFSPESFPGSYLRREAAFIAQHPALVERYKKVLRLLEVNPSHPSLRIHKLKGKFRDKYSVSITMAFRLVIAFVITETEIILIDVGHHDEVY
jgi:mRNA-degrading endonuclease YafQ of YafQ-DinJ toxin-antitoxin module